MVDRLSEINSKFIIRGTREGLWFEVVKISGDDIDIASDGEVVAIFEIAYFNKEGRFKLSKIRFDNNLEKETKVIILNEVKDFVESLNTF